MVWAGGVSRPYGFRAGDELALVIRVEYVSLHTCLGLRSFIELVVEALVCEATGLQGKESKKVNDSSCCALARFPHCKGKRGRAFRLLHCWVIVV